MYTSGWELIAYIFAAIVGLVLLFAQIKMFSIDAKLSKILEIMERKKENKIEGQKNLNLLDKKEALIKKILEPIINQRIYGFPILDKTQCEVSPHL